MMRAAWTCSVSSYADLPNRGYPFTTYNYPLTVLVSRLGARSVPERWN
jgi:hypothetical protein